MTFFRTLPRWAQLLLVAILARAITFGNPIVHVDEQFYFMTARAWLDGALPYVDVWDRKPVGLFVVYLLPALFGYPLGIWAYQALALACVVGTAVLIARLADRAGWQRGALPAAIAYIVWLGLLDGQGGQSPVFYNLPIVLAAWLVAPRPDDADQPGRRFGWGLAALALVGIALQIKYSVVFEGLFFGLWWLWREHRLAGGWRRVLGGGALLMAAAAAPTAIAFASYAALGHANDYSYANFGSIFARRPDPLSEQLGNLLTIVLITSPLLSGAVLAWTVRDEQQPARLIQHWLFAWALSAILGLLAFGSWFDHYALPVLVPLTICCAGFASAHRSGAKAAPILLLVLVASQAALVIQRFNRGTPAQFAAVAQAIGHGPGCLYVFSGDSMLYTASGRCRLSRYVFPSHLGRLRERGAIGVDQDAEMRRILSRDPQLVVLRAPYRGERPELRAIVMARMAQAYRLKAHIAYGSNWDEVYELR